LALSLIKGLYQITPKRCYDVQHAQEQTKSSNPA
jgi:hypothetical protein